MNMWVTRREQERQRIKDTLDTARDLLKLAHKRIDEYKLQYECKDDSSTEEFEELGC